MTILFLHLQVHFLASWIGNVLTLVEESFFDSTVVMIFKKIRSLYILYMFSHNGISWLFSKGFTW